MDCGKDVQRHHQRDRITSRHGWLDWWQRLDWTNFITCQLGRESWWISNGSFTSECPSMQPLTRWMRHPLGRCIPASPVGTQPDATNIQIIYLTHFFFLCSCSLSNLWIIGWCLRQGNDSLVRPTWVTRPVDSCISHWKLINCHWHVVSYSSSLWNWQRVPVLWLKSTLKSSFWPTGYDLSQIIHQGKCPLVRTLVTVLLKWSVAADMLFIHLLGFKFPIPVNQCFYKIQWKYITGKMKF